MMPARSYCDRAGIISATIVSNDMLCVDEGDINEELALSLGWTMIDASIGMDCHQIWQGPLDIGYYALYPPQFTTEWSHLELLLRAMKQARYDNFTLQMLDDIWIAEFCCNYGPCKLHGTNTDQHHGSSKSVGKTLNQAVCFAAISALNSGEFITLRRDPPWPDDTKIVKPSLSKSLKIISEMKGAIL